MSRETKIRFQIQHKLTVQQTPIGRCIVLTVRENSVYLRWTHLSEQTSVPFTESIFYLGLARAHWFKSVSLNLICSITCWAVSHYKRQQTRYRFSELQNVHFSTSIQSARAFEPCLPETICKFISITVVLEEVQKKNLTKYWILNVRSERNIKFKNSMRYQNSATSTCQQA